MTFFLDGKYEKALEYFQKALTSYLANPNLLDSIITIKCFIWICKSKAYRETTNTDDKSFHDLEKAMGHRNSMSPFFGELYGNLLLSRVQGMDSYQLNLQQTKKTIKVTLKSIKCMKIAFTKLF